MTAAPTVLGQSPAALHDAGRGPAAAVLSPHASLVLRVTALTLLVHGSTSNLLEVALRIACGVMLAVPGLLACWGLWVAVVGAIAYLNLAQWFSIDNHKYLIMYWALACCLAVATPADAEEILRRNARLMVGICFALAVAWKLYAGEYLDGSFIQHVFLTDSRVSVPVSALLDIHLTDLQANRVLSGYLASWPADGRSITLNSSATLAATALAASAWTLLIESAVALFWLLPRPAQGKLRAAAAARDVSLIVFILTTYVLLPVVGFATALSLLGLAATEPNRPRTRLAYLCLVLAVQLTSIPWESYVIPLLFGDAAAPAAS